jgi:cytochrome b561
MALMILGLLAVGFYMTSQKISPDVIKLYMTHKSVGLSVLTLAVLRLLWRISHPAPPPPAMPRWQHLASQISHGVLYGLMFAMPISGWLMNSATGTPMKYFGFFKVPPLISRSAEQVEFWKSVHGFLAWSLLALICIHLLAVLKHQLIDRDGLLSRMRF